MRAVSASWRTLIPYSHPILTTVESWLSGKQLARSVPITGGKIQYDATGVLQRRLTLTVPARTPTERWDPAGNPTHPLAAYGQRLHVRTGIGYPNGGSELLDHGWYLVTSWKHQEEDRTIAVEAVDLAQLIVDDRLTKPSTPPAGATFRSEFARLVGGILPVVIDPALADRAVSKTAVWERDRDKALTDLCTAWPARWYVDDTGAAHAVPPWGPVSDTTPPVLVLTDGAVGTVTGRYRQSERGALYNVMVVDGKATDTGAAGPHAEATITAPGSPIRVTGPYGRVTRFYASELITTQAQAQDTANAQLVTYATAGRAEGATAVPDPSIQLGDVARIYTRDGDAYTGRIAQLEMPLTPADVPMAAQIAMLPAGVIEGERTGGV